MTIFKTSMDEKQKGFKTEEITSQKDLLSNKSINDSFDEMDLTLSSHKSLKKTIPKGNLPDGKDDATDLLQSQSAIHEEPRELHVALDNSYQGIESSDGHYMTKLKRIINGNSNIRAERWATDEKDDDGYYYLDEQYMHTDTQKDAGFISKMASEGQLEDIIKKMDEIISTCRKYRLTHPWPWTQRGKERKADVIKVQKEAENRKRAARARIEVIKRNTSKVVGGGERSAIQKATGGFNRVLNYGKTFLWGMTVRNVVNTAAFAVSLPFWLVGSIVKSAASIFMRNAEFGAYGAFTLPHPHFPGTWYNLYATKTIADIAKGDIKKLEDKLKTLPPGIEYNDTKLAIEHLSAQQYIGKNSRWHSFFSGSTAFDNVGYSAIKWKAGSEPIDFEGMKNM